MNINASGWLDAATIVASPNYDERPEGSHIDLIVVHAISLPPDEFGDKHIQSLFLNQLDPDQHPYFRSIYELRVSAHFVIDRNGALTQFVSCLQRAWHAGKSCWQGRESCNNFSIGIELEGSDHQPFEEIQYLTLNALVASICATYPIREITGHQNIAPDRKTDPGPFFDWSRVDNLPMANGI